VRERATVLLAARMPAEFEQRLTQRFELLGPLLPPFAQTVSTLAAEDAQRVRVLITMGSARVTREALARLPSLGLVCCIGSGFEGIDLAAARDRRIVVTHGPDANASTVADLALGLLIATVRRMPAEAAILRRGEWKGNAAHRMPPVRGLTGRKVGIYGLGAIGAKIAARCVAFEMEVGYHNRNRRDDVAYRYLDSLEALASWADVLVIAVRAGADTVHAVDARILAALGSGGHVVNIARGSVIDETALVRALAEGTIAGAGLDVFEHEPSVPAELLAMTSVALTPHIAGATTEAQGILQDMVCSNMDAFMAGLPVRNPVPGTPASYP